MTVSLVIRTRDEADRLRLTLAALASQSEPAAEIIVVDDGSVDHTGAILAEAAATLPLTVLRHDTPRGRSGASNAGARLARGEILLFLDGDVLAGPELVARHAAAHAAGERLVGRGETFHLRCTRFLRDPEAGTPQPGEGARLAALPAGELDRLRVTRQQVREDFGAIERRAAPGVYPGAGPRRLYELEMDALLHHPACTVLWAAASGQNLSMRRAEFLDKGGFDERFDINEHRELALRLCAAGNRMVPVPGARSYHLTHRVGWRDPLREAGWHDIFYRAHPIPEVALLPALWAGLSDEPPAPGELRLDSLPALEMAARKGAKGA